MATTHRLPPAEEFFVSGLAAPLIRRRGQFSPLPGKLTPTWRRPLSLTGPVPRQAEERRRLLVEPDPPIDRA